MTLKFIGNTALAAITAIGMVSATAGTSSALTLCALPCVPGPTVHPTPPPHHSGRGEAAALGVVGGILLGTLAASAARNGRSAGASAAEKHVAFCAGKYNTYNPATNMYMSYSGPKYCKSPYL